jgi:very-short-patch-repair endonuclease
MTNILILLIILVALAALISFFQNRQGGAGPKGYLYKRKPFFLSRAEHECHDALVQAVGKDYLIFAQVHLPTIVDHKVPGQSWIGAFRHINGKSVDFVLCDRAYIAPKLAIELDDQTHERSDRQDRDHEVERILKTAGVPLLRLINHGRFDPSDLAQKIKAALGNSAEQGGVTA